MFKAGMSESEKSDKMRMKVQLYEKGHEKIEVLCNPFDHQNHLRWGANSHATHSRASGYLVNSKDAMLFGASIAFQLINAVLQKDAMTQIRRVRKQINSGSAAPW